VSDYEIIRPPESFTVETERRPVLYTADGTPLVQRPIGFDVRPQETTRRDEC
jgi:hypothetical protein